jgi:hypothetical protein
MTAMSFIAPQERTQARSLIEKSLGFSLPTLKGREIAVKLWVREEDIILGLNPQGQEIKLTVPQTVYCEDSAHSCAGLVVGRGQNCPEDGVQIGDFVLMPRYEGTSCVMQGVPLRLIALDKLYGVIQDPQRISH